MTGPFREFKDWYLTLSQTTKERMNLHDLEFAWMAKSLDIKPAIRLGRKQALRDLYNEYMSHDYFAEAQRVESFYKTDIAYDGTTLNGHEENE